MIREGYRERKNIFSLLLNVIYSQKETENLFFQVSKKFYAYINYGQFLKFLLQNTIRTFFYSFLKI